MGNFQDTYKVTTADRAGKGVTGLPDTPGLSTGDMQTRFDSLGNLAIDKFNALIEAAADTVTNDDKKFPTSKAIVGYVGQMGGGDMQKVVYDTDDDGVVNDSDKLGGQLPTHYKNEYRITLPTTGYTLNNVADYWGKIRSLYEIIITTDYQGDPLTNFSNGMASEFPIIAETGSSSIDDYRKFVMHEIKNGSVKVWVTSPPTYAFDVIIKEA